MELIGFSNNSIVLSTCAEDKQRKTKKLHLYIATQINK